MTKKLVGEGEKRVMKSWRKGGRLEIGREGGRLEIGREGGREERRKGGRESVGE